MATHAIVSHVRIRAFSKDALPEWDGLRLEVPPPLKSQQEVDM